MSEQSIASGQEFGSRDSDPADPIVANLQQSAKLANENCDRAVALNQTLSAQLREAQDRINQLEREADELGEQLLVEARAIIQDVQSNADATINRTIREADERIARLKAEAENLSRHYSEPFMRAVATLPRQDLAKMAEVLVNLTAFLMQMRRARQSLSLGLSTWQSCRKATELFGPRLWRWRAPLALTPH